MAKPYILPNRKAFADHITRIFLKYRDKGTDDEDKDIDLCTKRGNARELLPHQKIVREYLSAETPYRGLLVYHGLGSGKTCSSATSTGNRIAKDGLRKARGSARTWGVKPGTRPTIQSTTRTTPTRLPSRRCGTWCRPWASRAGASWSRR
jgi:hypothetical protein